MRSARLARRSISDFQNAQLLLSAKQIQVKFSHVSKMLDLTPSPIVAKIDAVQAEYSAFETLHETDGLIDTARELGIAYVAYSPLGHGWLVDDFPFKSPDDFAPDDFRRTGKSHHPPPLFPGLVPAKLKTD